MRQKNVLSRGYILGQPTMVGDPRAGVVEKDVRSTAILQRRCVVICQDGWGMEHCMTFGSGNIIVAPHVRLCCVVCSHVKAAAGTTLL